jgi:hypothetical protein
MNDRDSICIDAGVDPLLTELREPIDLLHADRDHPARHRLHSFIRADFQGAHGARVDHFYPSLLGFSSRQGLRAVIGFRGGCTDGRHQPLFAEQYLDAPAEDLVRARTGLGVARHALVEVGNLALDEPGHARWVIAASTAYLAAAGYRWVLFTATRPLANAFLRLGLRPVALAPADPARLPDGGASWGRYYEHGPVVYAGDILAGARKLQAAVRMGRPQLQALLRASVLLGAEWDDECAGVTPAGALAP